MAEINDEQYNHVSNSPGDYLRKNAFNEVEFQVSQVINRLEEAVIGKNESATEGGHVDDVLPNNLAPSQPNSVMGQLEDLFLHGTEDDGELMQLPELCETSRLSVATHAIAALAGSMERSHVANVSAKIAGDTSKFILDLFRCPKCNVSYHDDQLEGLVRIVRALLHTRVPHYSEHAFEALTNKLPIIYTSVAAPMGIVQHLCRQLGLPIKCVNPIPCNTLFGSQKMDITALERDIESDKISSNKLPLIVLADAGTPISGHVDSINRLREICRANNIWLHLRGHCLAALAIPESSNLVEPIADSLTLPIGIWLGIPGLPTATVYAPERLAPQSLVMIDHPGRKLISLPLWTALQNLGREAIRKRFKEAFTSCHQLSQKLKKIKNIRVTSQTPGGEGGVITVAELASKPLNPIILFDVTACSVVFQFIPENYEGRVPTYFDKLNSWLGQILQRDCPQIPVTICEIENGEVVLRYCPLEPLSSTFENPDWDVFIECLDQQIEILCATVTQKMEFQRLVNNSKNLELVEIEGWAGLGGVRYHPPSFSHPLSEQAIHILNTINSNLVENLRALDAAFSLGEGEDGLVCVRFGMVTNETDVIELLNLVELAGNKEEQSEQVLEDMAQVLKKGIEAATMELKKESEEQLWQEGILRQVPVVGSIVNWWSPSNKPSSGIKGRSLDLTAGIVHSTENIYRYHMQASPSQQVVSSTPVGHSRSSSASSSQPSKSLSQIQEDPLTPQPLIAP